MLESIQPCGLLVRFALLFFLVASVSPAAIAEGPAGGAIHSPMTLSQVVNTMMERNVERARALESYSERRIYTIAYTGILKDFRASMVVDMTYRAPGSKSFTVVSESGPKWAVNEILKRLTRTEAQAQQAKNRKNVDLNTVNYDFSNLEYQPVPDGCSYSLWVQPKRHTKYLYRGRIWVNDRDFAVCRVEARPSKTPSFWILDTTISHRYHKVGKFWLPVSDKSVSNIRFGGKATLTISYLDTKIIAAQPVKENSPVSPDL